MANKFSRIFLRFKALMKIVNNFIKEDVWDLNVQALSRTKARLVRDLMVTLDAIQGMNEKNLGMLSVSLCYFCTLALVPFVAVCFAVTGGLGLSDSLTGMLYEYFSDNQQIIDMVIGAADNILHTARSGGFGLLSALLFVWLVIWMMDRIEKVFNVIWGVPQPKKDRKVLKSYSIDIAIMVLAPFIIMAFFAGSVVYSNVLDIFLPQKEAFSEGIRSLLGWVIFGASIVMIISAMYKFIPTTRVEYRHALRAAMIAGAARWRGSKAHHLPLKYVLLCGRWCAGVFPVLRLGETVQSRVVGSCVFLSEPRPVRRPLPVVQWHCWWVPGSVDLPHGSHLRSSGSRHTLPTATGGCHS